MGVGALHAESSHRATLWYTSGREAMHTNWLEKRLTLQLKGFHESESVVDRGLCSGHGP
jgi:hypothetical protein